jgi:hypothetical protein
MRGILSAMRRFAVPAIVVPASLVGSKRARPYTPALALAVGATGRGRTVQLLLGGLFDQAGIVRRTL